MLRHYTQLLLLLATGCASGPVVLAGDTERLNTEIPADWIKVIDRKVGHLHVAEYYPPDTGEVWQQKLSVEALSGDDLPDPLEFVGGLAEQQSKVCDDFSDNSVFAGFENGYPAAVHMMQCGRSKRTGKALLTMIKVIQGNQASYTVTRIWRLDPAVKALASETDTEDTKPTAKIPVNQAELGAWSQSLRKINVCDPALAAHTCD